MTVTAIELDLIERKLNCGHLNKASYADKSLTNRHMIVDSSSNKLKGCERNEKYKHRD